MTCSSNTAVGVVANLAPLWGMVELEEHAGGSLLPAGSDLLIQAFGALAAAGQPSTPLEGM